MKQVTFRFYEELNDLLPREVRKRRFQLPFRPERTVKDWIESLGIPHTEVDLILINGKSVDFDYLVQPADDIAVYPVFESFDIQGVTHLRPEPLRDVRFIADVHLGKLVRYLRMLGFDTYYDNRITDPELIDIALREKRIILTMDRGILKQKKVTHGFCITSYDPREQLKMVIKRFDLRRKVSPFSRCLICNQQLREVDKALVENRLPPQTRRYYQSFNLCPGCNRIYWKGSHFQRMQEFLKQLQLENEGDSDQSR